MTQCPLRLHLAFEKCVISPMPYFITLSTGVLVRLSKITQWFRLGPTPIHADEIMHDYRKVQYLVEAVCPNAAAA